MQLTGIIRIARTDSLRYLPNGAAVLNIAGVYTYGKKADNEQYKPSQFIDISIWGKQAEGLAQYLVKGVKLSVDLIDVHIDTFTKNDGTVVPKLVARLRDLEFCGGDSDQSKSDPGAYTGGAKTQKQQKQNAPGNSAPKDVYDDAFDDDIPF